MLFVVAYPIFVSPQFLIGKLDQRMFAERIRSIVDWGETSNAQRLQIWRQTLVSITDRPLVGVGIGNYPVVLDQNIFLARAGSSAHNIYLHIAAEIGLVALAAWIWLWTVLYVRVFRWFRDTTSPFWSGYSGWLLLSLPWVAAYLLTDAALFDERALLLFALIIALIPAHTVHLNHG
jgi:putative inorganic carbon (HCO3(-)) transporter